MLIRRQTTTLLQIFCEISLHSQVIFKSMKVADDISRGTLECEWVKLNFDKRVVGVCQEQGPKGLDYFDDNLVQGLNQDLDTGCPKLANGKLDRPIFLKETIIYSDYSQKQDLDSDRIFSVKKHYALN